MRGNRNSHSVVVGMQSDTTTLEDSLAVFYKTNILLPYDPAIKQLGIDPNELKTYVHTKTFTQVFIAAPFIVAKAWKQPKNPLVSE